MNNFADILPAAWTLVAGADPQLWGVVALSMQGRRLRYGASPASGHSSR